MEICVSVNRKVAFEMTTSEERIQCARYGESSDVKDSVPSTVKVVL